MQLIDPTKIDPSPYQPKTRLEFTADELADILTVRGDTPHFIDVPIVSRTATDRFEMVSGWRRRAAWMLHQPGKLMPAEIRDKEPERNVFKTFVLANEGRTNFSAVEKADLCAKAIELGYSQAEAGGMMNPPIKQAAVSHLLSLRKLPDEIKALIQAGQLPERIARPLVTPAKHAENLTIQAAHRIAAADEGTRDRVARDEVDNLYRKAGINLYSHIATPWAIVSWNKGKYDVDLSWPTKPIDVPDVKPDKGEISPIVACEGCPFAVQSNDTRYCMRPACHAVKVRVWNAQHKAKEPTMPEQGKKRNNATKAANAREAELKKKVATEKTANEAEIKRLCVAAVEAILPKLPDFPEEYIYHMLQHIVYDCMWNDTDHPDWMDAYSKMGLKELRAIKKAAEKQHYIKAAIIMNEIDASGKPNDLRQNVAKFCEEFKVKLPKGWDAAPEPKPEKPKKAK